VKALFASAFVFAAACLFSSDTSDNVRADNSGEGIDDGGVDLGDEGTEDASLIFKRHY
jgi:hypothetical protein